MQSHVTISILPVSVLSLWSAFFVVVQTTKTVGNSPKLHWFPIPTNFHQIYGQGWVVSYPFWGTFRYITHRPISDLNISSYFIFVCRSARGAALCYPGSVHPWPSQKTFWDLPSVRIRVLRPHQASPNDPDGSAFLFSKGSRWRRWKGDTNTGSPALRLMEPVFRF